MENLASPTREGWQPGRIPQLKYRNPAPSEDKSDYDPLRELTNTNDKDPTSTAADAAKPSGPTIRQIRQSMAATAPKTPSPQLTTMAKATPTPRKKSIFGSLFTVKEPTQIALNQVQAQMIAQHGSTSATKVPHVRMEKMPDFVPKVNTKWDGVPESVKIREKQEKGRQRALRRQSQAGSAYRSHSADSREPGVSMRKSYASSSTGSRPKSTNSQRSNPRNPNPHRFYATSCNSSGDLAAQQRDHAPADDHRPTSSMSQSFRSSFGTSLPSIKAYFPNEVPLAVPEKYWSGNEARITDSVPRRPKMELKQHSHETSSSIEAIPEHTSSPIATPRERSPVTPLTQQAQEISINETSSSSVCNRDRVTLQSTGMNVLPLPTVKPRKLVKQPSDAFLAGEAKPLELPDDDDPPSSSDLPLHGWNSTRSRASDRSNPPRSIDKIIPDIEKRPDSSRARLGLRVSMLLRTDATPWEGQDDGSTPPLSPRSASTRSSVGPLTPKGFLSKSLVGSLRSTRS